MIVQFIDYLNAHARQVRVSCFIGIGILAVWSLTVDTHSAESWIEKVVPVFWGIFSFLSGLVLIFFSRWLGRSGIKAREDYYDK